MTPPSPSSSSASRASTAWNPSSTRSILSSKTQNPAPSLPRRPRRRQDPPRRPRPVRRRHRSLQAQIRRRPHRYRRRRLPLHPRQPPALPGLFHRARQRKDTRLRPFHRPACPRRPESRVRHPRQGAATTPGRRTVRRNPRRRPQERPRLHRPAARHTRLRPRRSHLSRRPLPRQPAPRQPASPLVRFPIRPARPPVLPSVPLVQKHPCQLSAAMRYHPTTMLSLLISRFSGRKSDQVSASQDPVQAVADTIHQAIEHALPQLEEALEESTLLRTVGWVSAGPRRCRTRPLRRPRVAPALQVQPPHTVRLLRPLRRRAGHGVRRRHLAARPRAEPSAITSGCSASASLSCPSHRSSAPGLTTHFSGLLNCLAWIGSATRRYWSRPPRTSQTPTIVQKHRCNSSFTALPTQCASIPTRWTLLYSPQSIRSQRVWCHSTLRSLPAREVFTSTTRLPDRTSPSMSPSLTIPWHWLPSSRTNSVTSSSCARTWVARDHLVRLLRLSDNNFLNRPPPNQ